MDTGNLRIRTRRSAAAVLRDSAIGTAIAHLPDTLRWVMILGEGNGLSTRELADLTGVSCKVIESTHDQGLALIRKELMMGAQCGITK